MARLSRRSLFAGAAALPALLPVMAAARPARLIHVPVFGSSSAIFGETLSARVVESPRPRLVDKAGVRALFRAVDEAVGGPALGADAIDDLAADDRAFGWEG